MYKSIKNIIKYILHTDKIGKIKKRKFYAFGKGSVVYKPYLQLSGVNNIVIGNNTTILSNSRLSTYGNSKQPLINIGNNCYIGFGFTILAGTGAKINIGNDVLIASNVLITNENHGINPDDLNEYMNQKLYCKNVSIGDGCWIGEKVCILPGVNIGKKCVIGAGAIVTKSVPDYSIAVGNPARVIKKYDFNKHSWENI